MMARLRVSTWSALAVGIGFLLSEAIMLDARIRDYDEGVYWATFRALARGEPMFSTVFATSPPGFFYALLPFYLVVHSLASLRAGVLLLCLAGLAATYVMGRLLAGNLGGLVAVLLSATSSVYWHESRVLQADGPSLALSTVAVALAMLAVRTEARGRDALAAAAGVALAFSVGTKFFGVVAAVPIAIVLLGASRSRARLVTAAVLGGVLGLLILLVPIIGSPQAAYKQLIVSHLRAGELAHFGIGRNLSYVFLRHELPLEALGLAGAVLAHGQPHDAWFTDNAYAVAAADRDIPGPVVDTSGQLALAGLLTVGDLERTRVRYDVRWVLVDNGRLERFPGFHAWLLAHFHPVQRLGGGAVIYEAGTATAAHLSTEFG